MKTCTLDIIDKHAVLVGCEESQQVTKAFRTKGITAYSCDTQETRGNPEWHIKEDIKKVIPARQWDIIILHPDCTAMAVSGNRWYGRGKQLHNERIKAIEWTVDLWEIAKKYSNKVALENPVSVIFKHLPNVHYIHPWQHGHGVVKKTGFALHNLPPLKPSKIVEGREPLIWKMAPSKTRKRDRSKTFTGVAKAIAGQWCDR